MARFQVVLRNITVNRKELAAQVQPIVRRVYHRLTRKTVENAKVDAPAPDGARVLHEEYRPGDFYRSFILSDEVERSKISAELKHGVLRLNLPKAERAKTRRIEIKTS